MSKKAVFRVAVTGLLFFFSLATMAQTDVTENITEPTTWTISGSPYVINNNQTFSIQSSLIIEDNVVVQASVPISLKSTGSLSANNVTLDGTTIAIGGRFEIQNSNLNLDLNFKSNGSGTLRSNVISKYVYITSDLSSFDIVDNIWSIDTFTYDGSRTIPDQSSFKIIDGINKYKFLRASNALTVYGEVTFENGVEVILEDVMTVYEGGKLKAQGATFNGKRITVIGSVEFEDSVFGTTLRFFGHSDDNVMYRNTVNSPLVISTIDTAKLDFQDNLWASDTVIIEQNSIGNPTTLAPLDGLTDYKIRNSLPSYQRTDISALLTVMNGASFILDRASHVVGSGGIVLDGGRLAGSSISIFTYLEARNATIDVAITIESEGKATITDSKINKTFTSNTSSLTITDSAFPVNDSPAFVYNGDSDVTLSLNDFYGDSDREAIINNTEHIVTLTDSYFGSVSGPFIPENNPTGSGVSFSGTVSIPSWSSTPVNPNLGQSVELIVNIVGEGILEINELNEVCDSSSCIFQVDRNSEITLTPIPKEGSIFTKWEFAGCEDLYECTLEIESDNVISVEFIPEDLVADKLVFIDEIDDFKVYKIGDSFEGDWDNQSDLDAFLQLSGEILVAAGLDVVTTAVVDTFAKGLLGPAGWAGAIRAFLAPGIVDSFQLIIIDENGQLVTNDYSFTSGTKLYPLVLVRTEKTCRGEIQDDSSFQCAGTDLQSFDIYINPVGQNEQFNAQEYNLEFGDTNILNWGTGIRDLDINSLYLFVPAAYSLDLNQETFEKTVGETGLTLNNIYGYEIGLKTANPIPIADQLVGSFFTQIDGIKEYFIFNNGSSIQDYLAQIIGGDPTVTDMDGDGISDSLEAFLDNNKNGIRDIHEGSIVIPGVGELDAQNISSVLAMRARYDGENKSFQSFDDDDTCPAFTFNDGEADTSGNDVWIYSDKGRIALGRINRQKRVPFLSESCGSYLDSALQNRANSLKNGISDFIIDLGSVCEESDIECRTATVTMKLPTPLSQPTDGERLTYKKFYSEKGWVDYERVYSSDTGLDFNTRPMGVITPGHQFIRLELVDGGDGDADGELNGIILDPGAAAYVTGPTASFNSANEVTEGETVTLDGGLSQPVEENGVLEYRWSQLSGVQVTVVDEHAKETSFEAPQVDSNQEIVIQLIVTEDGVESEPSTKTITILNVNNPPVVDAGDDQSVTEGDTVTLNATATDADGQSLEYRWEQESGEVVSLSGADSNMASFVAPDTDSSIELVFKVSATDGEDTSEDSLVITVNRANQPPIANAGEDISVIEGNSVTLSGTASDSDNDSLIYSWTQVSGPSVTINNSNELVASFTAPQVTSNQSLEFMLTVTDGIASVSDNVIVTVNNQTDTPVTQKPQSGESGGGGSVNMYFLIMLLSVIWLRRKIYI